MKFSFRPQSRIKVIYSLKKRNAHAEIESFFGRADFTYFDWPSEDCSEEQLHRVILKEIAPICKVLTQESVDFYHEKQLVRTMFL